MNGAGIDKALKSRHISQRALARALDMDTTTVNKMIKGTRKITADEALLIDAFLTAFDEQDDSGDAFAVVFEERYLKKAREFTQRPTIVSPQSHHSMVELDEVNVSAMGGAGAIMDQEEAVKTKWLVPKDLLSPVTDTVADNIKIITVSGDSMFPEIPAGTRVMVDINHRAPSPLGIYVLWDGAGLILKRLELLSHKDEEPKVKLISSNPAYEDRIEALSDIDINGRVIGRWTWT